MAPNPIAKGKGLRRTPLPPLIKLHSGSRLTDVSRRISVTIAVEVKWLAVPAQAGQLIEDIKKRHRRRPEIASPV